MGGKSAFLDEIEDSVAWKNTEQRNGAIRGVLSQKNQSVRKV